MITVGRWIHLPRGASPQAPFRADAPVGAGVVQITASNSAHACAVNGTRVLWEDTGSASVWLDLARPGDVTSVRWHALDADGGYVRCVGPCWMRPWGASQVLPRVVLRCQLEAPSGHASGVVLACSTPGQVPDMRPGTWSADTSTAPVPVPVECALQLPADALATRDVDAPDGGQLREAWIWCASWCTSGALVAKSSVYGVTVSVEVL